MRTRDRVALTLPTLALRLLLALIFIWAGLTKVLTQSPVGPTDAARLARMGLPVNPPTAPPSPTDTTPDTDTDDAPPPATPADPVTPPDDPADDTPDAAPAIDDLLPDEPATTPPPATPADPDPTPDADPEADPDANPAPATDPEGGNPFNPDDNTTPNRAAFLTVALTTATPATPPPASSSPPAAQPAAPPVTAADFPEGGATPSIYNIALLLDTAANPGLDADSNPIPRTLPAAIANSPWPAVLAWTAAITEILAGLMLLVGLFTRLSAFTVACIMLTAMWLTQFGPAIQSGTAFLGFLPDHSLASLHPWQPLLFQLSMFTAALAVFFLGSGALGLDAALFRRREPAYTPPPRGDLP